MSSGQLPHVEKKVRVLEHGWVLHETADYAIAMAGHRDGATAA